MSKTKDWVDGAKQALGWLDISGEVARMMVNGWFLMWLWCAVLFKVSSWEMGRMLVAKGCEIMMRHHWTNQRCQALLLTLILDHTSHTKVLLARPFGAKGLSFFMRVRVCERSVSCKRLYSFYIINLPIFSKCYTRYILWGKAFLTWYIFRSRNVSPFPLIITSLPRLQGLGQGQNNLTRSLTLKKMFWV